MKTSQFSFKLLTLSCLFAIMISCGNDDTIDVSELPGTSWEVLLNGVKFSVTNTNRFAYYDSFSGDLTVVGTKSLPTEERIVLTFSVENGAPFIDGQPLDLSIGSGNSILYYDAQSNKYSSHFLDGEGTFQVDQYIETESRNYLSGTVNGVLFNEADSSNITVAGSFALKTF